MSRFEHDFTSIASDYNLPTIASLHRFHDHMFVYKSLHNYVSSQCISDLFMHRQLTYNLRYGRELSEDFVHILTLVLTRLLIE